MKTLAIIFLLSFSFGILLNGCDSATQTKASNITVPVLVAPPDNSTGQSLTPLFKWTNPGNKIEIDVNSSFANPLYSYDQLNGVSEYQLPPIGLLNSKDYYWRVGVNSSGTMYWSQKIFHFRTKDP